MDKVYYAAEVYSLSMRHVVGEEKTRLENRMKWVLTGSEEFGKDSIAIGNETAVRKQNEKAEKRIEGTTRVKKRKGKSSRFFKRPDKRFTEKRRALSNSKSDKLDSKHNPDESSNYADDEDQDVDMEVD